MSTQTPGHQSRPAATRTLLLVGVVAVAAALLVALMHWTAVTQSASTAVRRAPREPGEKSRGPAGAPVTIEVFSDFLCGHCADFAAEIEPVLVAEFVEPGDARLVHRQFPIVGPLSAVAAVSSECAADQQRFWAYHDALFARARRHALRERQDLDEAAREIGLDARGFAACLVSNAAKARVAADLEEGQRRGVQGTPTTFIGQREIVGTQSIETFRAAINAARAR